jgi:5-deoxy-glucuronate isomerase
MDFGLLKLAARAKHRLVGEAETVAVLLQGRARVNVAGKSAVISRRSVFEQGPFTISLGVGHKAEIESISASEWVVMRTTVSQAQGARLYRPADCADEDRGAGLAQGACRRLVRTIFDHAARPDSAFVVGEVINLPGRWSSYPPHHHPQLEIYYYRFTEPQGYGHAEIGDQVHRVMSGDATVIPGGLDHAQVSAPGYGMYYLWVVRHLPRNPYRGFAVTREHQWLLNPRRQGWKPSARLFA